ncbi:hypothetical protein DENSPDRAFT_876904 [Dentipellis sp. KUC8613]|nr:hypothetical protein DENSPDRAFT_876904 [Dentipellis sp. KUC8613]
MRNSSSRYGWVGFSFLLCSSLFGASSVQAGQVNITVDDTDPSILYQPAAQWYSNENSSSCSFCLTPSDPYIAFRGSWHHGLHVIPTTDADDDIRSSDKDSDSTKGEKNSGKKGRRRERRDKGDSDKDSSHGSDHDDDDDDTNKNPFVAQKFDSDDPQFVDTPVFAQFNFTGSALYLYCLLPLGLPANSNSTPTLTNLTFTLDNEPAGNFLHFGSDSASGFQPNTSVFTRTGLSTALHTFRVDLGPDSVFLLDYYVIGQADLEDNSPAASSTDAGPSPSQSVSSSDPIDAKTKEHNIATFGGAVGGSVGLLAVIASCLALSIYRRRRRSALRQRRERHAYSSSDVESFHTDASEDGPPMQGPAPFIPRYFPGTVPVAPPPYIPARTSLTPPVSASASASASAEDSEETPLSYADRPPPTPPPASAALLAPLDDVEDTEAPPPFMVAIASPEPPLLANIRRRAPERPPPAIPSESSDEVSSAMLRTDSEAGAGELSRPPSVRVPASRPESIRSARSAAGRAESLVVRMEPPNRERGGEGGL